MLVLAAITFGTLLGLERMGVPVLFKEISEDLNLSLVSIGTIWGMDPLAGIFVALLGGLLADRFGIKRTLIVVSILAGIFCALRGLSTGFTSLAATMFLFGLMCAMVPTIVSKITVVWFSGKYLTLSNAVLNIAAYISGMAATMLSATYLSPLLGGWRNVLFLYGAPGVAIGILWFFTGREPNKNEVQGEAPVAVPFKQAISSVIRMKEVWILGAIQAAFLGTNNGLVGYLPIYLRDIGWEPVSADTAITVLNGAIMVGSIPMVLLSNQLKAPKLMLVISMATLTASLALQPFVNGTGVFVLLAISGFLRSAAIALFTALIFQIKGVGSRLGGTAQGLAQAMGMALGFAAPPLGASFTGISAGAPFIVWAILAGISIPLFLFLREKKPVAQAAIVS
jgi:sugar phosphate permease